MSITINNGFKVNNVDSLEDATKFIERIRFDVKNEVQNSKAKDILSLACLMYDMHTLFNHDYFDEDDDRIPLSTAFKRMQESFFKDEYMRQFSLGIVYVDGHTLGMPFFPRGSIEKVLFKHQDVEKFGYWDNTDPDEDASEKEWKERKRLWYKALEPSWVPAEQLFMVTLVDERFTLPEDQHMERNFPTVEDREDNLAKTMAYEKARSKLEEEVEEIDFGKIMVKSKEFRDDLKKDVKDHIQKNLKMKDLEQTLPKGEK